MFITLRIEKWQCSAHLPNIKYNCALLFWSHLYWIFLHDSKHIFPQTPILKFEQKLLILSFQEEFTEVPAGCYQGEVFNGLHTTALPK